MYKVLFYSNLGDEFQSGISRFDRYLAASGKIELNFTRQLPTPGSLAQFDVLVLASPLLPTPEMAAELVGFVNGGGGLVCLGNSADKWAAEETLQTAFELQPGQRTPLTELIVRVPANSGHPVTRHLQAGYAHDHYAGLDRDTAFPLTDSFLNTGTLLSSKNLPVLLVSWQSQRLPGAWSREQGKGRLFYTGLGTTPSSWLNPVFHQLVFRSIVFAGGQEEKAPLGVALIGYGAIGFDHATACNTVPGLEFKAVCDRNPGRLEEARRAFPAIKTYDDTRQVLGDPSIDLVIVSTPPNLHAPLSLQMLEAGKHVVVEKPFCLTGQEADQMVAMANRTGKVLTIYQCRRWDPDYLAIKAVVDSGQIGEVFHMETFIGNFSHPCDYWHSHEPVSGGVFYDWGSHYLDWILGLMPGRVEAVSGFSHKRVWHDVTNEDQAKLVLRFEGGREAEFIHSDIAAALKPKWYILGTKGAIQGDWREEYIKTRRWNGDLVEDKLAPSEALPNLTVYLRQEGGPIHEQKLALPPNPVYPFHRNLAGHILNGEPLAITPEQARRNIIIMEAAKYSANQLGQFVPVEALPVTV